MRTIPSRCPKWIGRKKTIARGRAQTTTARSETGKRHTTTIPDEWPRPEAGGRFPSPGDALWWPGRHGRPGTGPRTPTRNGRPGPGPLGRGAGSAAAAAAKGWGAPGRRPAGRAAPGAPPAGNGPGRKRAHGAPDTAPPRPGRRASSPRPLHHRRGRGGGGKRSCTSKPSFPKGGGKVKGTGSGGGRTAQQTESPGSR